MSLGAAPGEDLVVFVSEPAACFLVSLCSVDCFLSVGIFVSSREPSMGRIRRYARIRDDGVLAEYIPED